ncbi:hypothetical protein AB1Y20_002460 [Prymnesium parvum]|uniref:Radical SAM core domain-containing protein n=1 Tax=Prymnesium parvum TaxID=97485 RepID=A0AB34JAH7_PRYPA
MAGLPSRPPTPPSAHPLPPLLDVEAVRAHFCALAPRWEPHVLPTVRAAVRLGERSVGAACASLASPPPAAFQQMLSQFALPRSRVVDTHATTAQRGFKLVVRLDERREVEAVAIVHEPEGKTQGRITVCVSSQVGCKMGCTFCATGTLGWVADLTAGEILEQVWHVERQAAAHAIWWRVTNVVFMGMGEPLNNYAAVASACRGLQQLWELSPSRITISTVGVVSRMRSLAADVPGVHLAISLHAATQARRLELVPSSSAYSVEKIITAMDDFIHRSRQSVMIEFILIEGVNALPDEADALGRLLAGRDVYVNLIPYNATAAGDRHGYRTPSDDSLRAFAARLAAFDLRVAVRWSSASGRSVDGACGQLALVRHAKGGGEAAAEPAGAAAEWALWLRNGVSRWLAGGGGGEGGEGKGGGEDIEELQPPRHAPPPPPAEGALAQQLLADGVPAAWAARYAYRSFSPAEGVCVRLRALLCEALRLPQLSEAHLHAEQPLPPPPLQHAVQLAGRALSAEARKQGTAAWLASDGRRAFLAAFRAFVRHVALPLLDDGSGKCVYQAEPTVRICFPDARPAGGPPRTDAARFHQAAELTFWLALTASDVRLARSPTDPSSVECVSLSPLECATWWGHRLAYGAAPATGEHTTVSLDFRVIPWSLYSESRYNTKRSRHDLRLGGYYAVMDAAAYDVQPS